MFLRLQGATEDDWTGEERWDAQSGFRLSFRFVPYTELGFEKYIAATQLLNEPEHAFKYGSSTPFKYAMPASVPRNTEKPSVVLFNTGGWEFGDTATHWDDYWKFAFTFRFMQILDRWRWNKPAHKFVWMTTSDIHVNAGAKLSKWGYCVALDAKVILTPPCISH